MASEHGLEARLDMIEMPMRERCSGDVLISQHCRVVVGGVLFESLRPGEITLTRAAAARTMPAGVE